MPRKVGPAARGLQYEICTALPFQSMGTTYHQFCPVAKAMELLDERWTMLVVRELVAGSTHFNELRRGVPRMNPTFLPSPFRSPFRPGPAGSHPAGTVV